MNKQIGELEIQTLVLGAVRTNCYIISNRITKEAIIIDPADKPEVIKSCIEKDDLDVVGILLTHGHFDHILAANELKQYYSVKLYANQNEKELLADSNMNCSANMRCDVSISLEKYLEDEEEITLARFLIKAIHTPGHTAGGTCYYFVNHGILISGDTLFLESVGRSDLPTGNGAKLLDSIKTKLCVLDEETIVFPGHGDTTTIGYEKKNNPYLNEEEFW